MTTNVVELMRISRSLPPRKVARLLDFARSLNKAQTSKNSRQSLDTVEGDAEWERIIAAKHPRPKLSAKIKALERLAAEGKDAPMDWERL